MNVSNTEKLTCCLRRTPSKSGVHITANHANLRVIFDERSAMASRTGIIISGHYVVLINATRYSMPFQICTLGSKNLKGWTESYFMLFLKLNDH